MRRFAPLYAWAALFLSLYSLFVVGGLLGAQARRAVEQAAAGNARYSAGWDRADWSVFPPRVRFSGLTLRLAERGLTIPSAEMGLSLYGFFPPRPALTLHAGLGQGTADVTLHASAWRNPEVVDAVWTFQQLPVSQLALLLPELPLGRLEGGLLHGRGEARFPRRNPLDGKGALTVTLEQGQAALQLPQARLTRLDGFRLQLDADWDSRTGNLPRLTLDHPDLTAGVRGGLRETAGGPMLDLDVRLAIPADKLVPELLPPRTRASFAQRNAVRFSVRGPLTNPEFAVSDF